MAKKLTTYKTSDEALKLLRLICAHTREKQYEAMERLLLPELEKIRKKEGKNEQQKV